MRASAAQLVILWIALINATVETNAFVHFSPSPSVKRRKVATTAGTTTFRRDKETPDVEEEEPSDDSSSNTDDDLANLLDKQFFDPSKVSDDSPIKWFANLVENDYETAEALYAGIFLYIMVVVSQELMRFQLYSNEYVPFQSKGNGLW